MSYTDNIKSLQDGEILNILAKSDEFAMEAVSAAFSEFEKRNLHRSELEAHVNAVQVEKAERLLRSEVALSDWLKVFYFIFPLAMFAPLWYEKEGYERKSKSSRKSIILGFCFYVLLVVVVSLFLKKKLDQPAISQEQVTLQQI